jgi:hypothetical protein
MTPQALLPALLVPLIGYRLYRRFRTSFGQQPIQTKRMVFRVVLFSVLGTVFLIAAASAPTALAGALGGLAAGAAVGMVGLRLTRFDIGPNGSFYTPNTYIGASVTALLVARLIYRFVAVAPTVQMASQNGPPPNPLAMYQSNPLTSAILMLTVGYYIVYFAGVLLKARQPRS